MHASPTFSVAGPGSHRYQIPTKSCSHLVPMKIACKLLQIFWCLQRFQCPNWRTWSQGLTSHQSKVTVYQALHKQLQHDQFLAVLRYNISKERSSESVVKIPGTAASRKQASLSDQHTILDLVKHPSPAAGFRNSSAYHGILQS